MDMGIRGRVAIVTGSGRGIGEGIAHGLANEGCCVAVCDRDLEPAQSVAEAIQRNGGRALAFHMDVANAESVRECAALVQEALGPIHILVNNAGFSRDGPLVEMTEEQWDDVVDVCLKGTWMCARAVAPRMIEAGEGRIINISSRVHLGEHNKSNYVAAKAGVVGITRALAIELGRYGVTVNSVAPGVVRTERVTKLPHFDDIDRRARASTPIQRMGTAEDIAATVVFLASAHAGYINGETIHVTGGRYSST